ncbi:MAG: hypothetical protein WB621_20345 [Candidatus Acidiferrales bacterium]
MRTKTILDAIDCQFDLDELDKIRIAVRNKIEEVRKLEQKCTEDAAWAKLRGVKVGDRVYPWKRIWISDLHQRNIMDVEPGDYLIVDYVFPRAHALWLRKKDYTPFFHGDRRQRDLAWKLAKERNDVCYFGASDCVRYEFTTARPEVAEKVSIGSPLGDATGEPHATPLPERPLDTVSVL